MKLVPAAIGLFGLAWAASAATAPRRPNMVYIVAESLTFDHLGRVQNYPYLFDPDQRYDLEADPGEQKNLAARPELAPKLAELKALLKSRIQKMDRPFGEFKEGAQTTPTARKGRTRDTTISEE